MTSTLGTPGMLCNHIFRNICVSLLAEKFDLAVTYSYADEIQRLGIPLYSGKNTYDNFIILNDENFLYLLLSVDTLQSNLYTPHAFFQTEEISSIIYQYIQFRRPLQIHDTNEVFIHIRLGDTISCNPGFNYYDKVLSSLTFTSGYIGSDSPDHEICRRLVEKYPSLQILTTNAIDTILLGSSKKYIILSHGTYSAIIGYLSSSIVYYPEYDYSNTQNAHSDKIFCIPSWNKVKWV